MLEECGHEVLVANARNLRLIFASKRKTDEIDSENLARLARLDPKLLYPVEHRREDSQAHMAIIRSRQGLVDCRTQLLNHIRGAVKSFGARLPKCEGQKLRQEGLRAHPRGAFVGPRSHSGDDRLPDDRAHPGVRPKAGNRLPKSTAPRPSSCARSRGSERLPRLPSC